MKVYAIFCGKDQLCGDVKTGTELLSVIGKAGEDGASGLSLHGEWAGEVLSGEVSLTDACKIAFRQPN